MSLDPVELDRFIDEEGEWVTHLTGLRCWCLTSDGQPRVTHTECEAGYLYRNPREIIGLITAIDQQKLWMQIGFAQPGDCVFSPRSDETGLSDRDKIVFLDPSPISEGQVIVRAHEATDALHYSASGAIYCEGEGAVEYHEKVSFVLEGKAIRWLSGQPQPAEGTQYALKYYGFLEWYVFMPPALRYSSLKDIGKKVLLRKKSAVVAMGA